MNKKIKKLAEKAGFCFWEDEEWGPGPDNIDWGPDYKEEFDKFCKSLILECAKISEKAEPYAASDLIKKEFGL